MKSKLALRLSSFVVFIVILTACADKPVQASTPASNNDLSASDKFEIQDMDHGTYQFEPAALNRESAVDLVLQLITQENPELEPVLMIYDNYYEDEFYGYILSQSKIGSQIITTKMTCAEDHDQYYLIRIYEDIIDDLSSREGHQATTEEFAVLKPQDVIIRGAILNAAFDKYVNERDSVVP